MERAPEQLLSPDYFVSRNPITPVNTAMHYFSHSFLQHGLVTQYSSFPINIHCLAILVRTAPPFMAFTFKHHITLAELRKILVKKAVYSFSTILHIHEKPVRHLYGEKV